MGHWIASRNYAQQAKAIYEELNDERNVGRLMLNLGGLQLMLGKPEQAIDHLQESFALAVEAESQPDAAQALGSLATVHLQLADYDAADENARKALALLGVATTSPTRSASPTSCSAARCSSATGSTRPRSASSPPTPSSSRWHPSATGPEHGSHAATSPAAAATTVKLPASTGSPLRRSRTSGSRKEVPQMRSARLLLLLANLALIAAWLGKFNPRGHTWSDGH